MFRMELPIPDQLSLAACSVGISAHVQLSETMAEKRCCQSNPVKDSEGTGLISARSHFWRVYFSRSSNWSPTAAWLYVLCRASIANSENQDYSLFLPAASLGAGVHRRPQLWRTALINPYCRPKFKPSVVASICKSHHHYARTLELHRAWLETLALQRDG